MLDVIAPLVVQNTTKIVLVSLDGLGGLPRPETGRSELRTAHLPNLSQLATEAACGLIRHVAPGITPGSGPGRLALFGYDPVETVVGRGVLEALGAGIDLRAGDVAARGNFCTVDASGTSPIGAPAASRLEINRRLTERLATAQGPGRRGIRRVGAGAPLRSRPALAGPGRGASAAGQSRPIRRQAGQPPLSGTALTAREGAPPRS